MKILKPFAEESIGHLIKSIKFFYSVSDIVQIIVFIHFLVNEYNLDINLIPRSPQVGCKVGYTRSKFGTCSCEEHCNWDLCRLVDPPRDCLRNTNSIWQWDDRKIAWVAQTLQNGNNNCTNNDEKQKSNLEINLLQEITTL